MTQRITITIPDSLHDRLQAVKDRINVSGICQEAIMHAVGIEEIKRQDVPEIEKLLARLHKEKEKYEIGWREQGIKDGRKDIHFLGYADLIALDKFIRSDTGVAVSVDSRGFRDFAEQKFWLRCDETVSRVEILSSQKDFNKDLYLEAWLEGITHAWDSIKDKLVPMSQTKE